MQSNGVVVLVTGAGRGIGRALCREFVRRGAAGVVAADLNGDLARATAAESGGLGVQCDVADADAAQAMVSAAERRYGRVDVLVSNAGFGSRELDLDDALSAPEGTWQRMWDVHVMAHVHACRAVLPGMLGRGSGCLVNIASAAGLLSQVGDTPYSVSKHAAVGLAESLAITYGDRGVQVSVVCPQYVATAITGLEEGMAAGSVPGVLTVGEAARTIVDDIEQGRFLILTHGEVREFYRNKAADYEHWIGAMRRVRDRVRGDGLFKVKT